MLGYFEPQGFATPAYGSGQATVNFNNVGAAMVRVRIEHGGAPFGGVIDLYINGQKVEGYAVSFGGVIDVWLCHSPQNCGGCHGTQCPWNRCIGCNDQNSRNMALTQVHTHGTGVFINRVEAWAYPLTFTKLKCVSGVCRRVDAQGPGEPGDCSVEGEACQHNECVDGTCVPVASPGVNECMNPYGPCVPPPPGNGPPPPPPPDGEEPPWALYGLGLVVIAVSISAAILIANRGGSKNA